MNKRPNEKLTDELIDSSLDEDNRLSLESVQKLVKDNLFYIIAGTSLAAWLVDYLYVTHYREFDPQPYLNGVWKRQPPTLEFALGCIGLLLVWLKDWMNKVEWSILIAFFISCLLSFDNGKRNQEFFDEGYIDGLEFPLGVDRELLSNNYYSAGVWASLGWLERIAN